MEKQLTASGNELMRAIKNAALKLQNMEPVYDAECGELLTEQFALTMVDLEVISAGDPDVIYAGYRLSGRKSRYKGVVAINRRTGELISGTWREVEPPHDADSLVEG